MMIYPVDIPEAALAAYCQRHHIHKLALFGSVLRDDFGADSDIDVLVAFEPNVHIGFLMLAAMQRELAELLRRPVDLVPESGLKPLLREEVLGSAEVLYAA